MQRNKIEEKLEKLRELRGARDQHLAMFHQITGRIAELEESLREDDSGNDNPPESET